VAVKTIVQVFKLLFMPQVTVQVLQKYQIANLKEVALEPLPLQQMLT
jgi:hypothetical protein